MIVPMKKATIVAQAKDAASSVAALRALGVVHVEHVTVPDGADVARVKDDINLMEQAEATLSGFKDKKHFAPALKEDVYDWRKTARHVIDLYKRLEQLQEYSRRISKEIGIWQEWGDFNPDAISRLAHENIFIRLYRIPANEIKNLPQGIIIKKISRSQGVINTAVISTSEIDVGFQQLKLPRTGLKIMRQKLIEDKVVIKSIIDELQKRACCVRRLSEARKELYKQLEFHQALGGMGQAQDLVYLSGYVPQDRADMLFNEAKKEKWGIIINDPSASDDVPTLIRNPEWVSIISPVFKVLEIVPGYKEFDISLWFLVFLSVFFGILIGDAGYGFIFLCLTMFAAAKFKDAPQTRPLFALFYILSSSAIVWGILSATFFGQEWLPAAVKPVLPALRNDGNVQAICFFIGALHLSIAHAWRAITKAPSLAALSDAGWIAILWGSFCLAKTLVLGQNFPVFAKWFFIIGPCMVILFANPHRNIFKALAGGLGSFLLSFVNCFTDVVSYIRLFAVGLATVAVADSFNKMALSIGFGSVFAGIATALILVLGHALNILLGPMSVLVHGVRLNVLEFCGHADVKWSGFEYRPLKEE